MDDLPDSLPATPQIDLYQQRLNHVLDYIRSHLSDDLSVAALADVAGFSPYHFHRLFRTLTGETLADCVLRLRLERAAALLKASPRMRVTTAAAAVGFVSAAHFSRVFRQHFGITARAWDRQTPLNNSKNGQLHPVLSRYTEQELSAAGLKARLARRSLSAQTVAVLRVTRPYGDPVRLIQAYHRLWDWYLAQGGLPAETTLYGVSQDDPEVTPLPLCRYDWCLRVPSHWEGHGAIRVVHWAACDVAQIAIQGNIAAVDQAWQFLYNHWLPHSRWWPANRPALEIYRRLPHDIGWEHFDLACAVPIVAMSE